MSVTRTTLLIHIWLFREYSINATAYTTSTKNDAFKYYYLHEIAV